MAKHVKHRGTPGQRLDEGRAAPVAVWTRSVWSSGTCFRCDRAGVDVTPIGTLVTLAMEAQVCACRACVFHMEQMHWAMLLGDDASPAE